MLFRQPFKGDYPITLDYGETWEPLYPPESPHMGIDYGCPEGTPIFASADGTVTLISSLSVGYGKHIKLQHADNYETLYAHLSHIDVQPGQQVHRGDVIGLSGSTGLSTGAHLHFEVRKMGIKIDPKTVLRNEIDSYPSSYTPTILKREFEPIHAGFCIVVCDVANVRCHCDMERVIDTIKKGEVISVGDKVTWYKGLPYRDFYHPTVGCWLRIAEHDPEDQIIRNYSGEV